MLSWLLAKIRRKKPEPAEAEPEAELLESAFSTHVRHMRRSAAEHQHFLERTAIPIKPGALTLVEGVAMDDSAQIKATFTNGQQSMAPALFAWYASQGFIGYQACAIISQNWLVSKACTVKGDDAVRPGYEVTVDSGDGADVELVAAIAIADKAYKVNRHLENASRFNEVFGIRHILFLVDSPDPEYYEKPFNPDGVTPGSYKGMSQIDPYWITPLLNEAATAQPASANFYEPTYWVVSGQKYHRSHFVILRGPEVPDVLKPSYLYGGLPLTQRIMERAYAAERTANEGPLLAMTKRLNVRKMDMAKAVAKAGALVDALELQASYRDNFGTLVIDNKEEMTQLETALADLDDVIMTQYQLVAAVANVPATKLLGTSPKGFNATGEHEIKSYNQDLETLQANELTPVVNRHHLCVMRSSIAPRFGVKPLPVDITWNPVDVPTSKERAEINEINARTDQVLQETGAVDNYEIRDRLISDHDSGYHYLETVERPPELDDGKLDDPTPPQPTGAFGADGVALDVVRKED